MLEEGRYASVSDILRQTLLAPAIVEGRGGADFNLPVLMEPFPMEWGSGRIP